MRYLVRLKLAVGRFKCASALYSMMQLANTKIVLRRDSSMNRITVRSHDTATDVIDVKFSADLARMLGFSPERTYGAHDVHVAEHPVSLYENLYLVYVYHTICWNKL